MESNGFLINNNTNKSQFQVLLINLKKIISVITYNYN